MKKWILSALLLSSTMAHGKTAQQFIDEIYPHYINATSCRIATLDETAYCMSILKTEHRNTPQGKLQYMLWTGYPINLNTLEAEYAHVYSGLAGMFVFRQLAGLDNWALLASSPLNTIGAYGQPPEAWTFHEFGKDKWGFLTEHSDTHQGYSGSHYVIFTHDGDKKITLSWIGASFSNIGAYGDKCEFYTGEDNVLLAAERKECLAKLTDMDSRIKILRDKSTVNGFYPLQITLNGYMGRTKWHNHSFVMPFNMKKAAYVTPKNYPLAEIDY